MLALALPAMPPTLTVDGLVIAAKTGGRWREVELGKGWKSRPATTFREVGVAKLGRTMRADFAEEEVPRGVYLHGGMIDITGVLVGGVTPRTPRRATELPANSPVYAKVLRRYLDTHGLKGAKARATRIVSVDLDGDGTREVLIEASNRNDLLSGGVADTFHKGDYAVVLLRAVRNGRIVETPLGSPRDGLVRKLRAIGDLDGDGRMEVVLSYTAWEAFGASLWTYRAARASLQIETGTGV